MNLRRDWCWPLPDIGEIEVLFSDPGRVSLTHSGLPFPDEVLDDCQSGWQMALAVLGQYVENYFEQPKQTLLVMKEATFDFGSRAQAVRRSRSISAVV